MFTFDDLQNFKYNESVYLFCILDHNIETKEIYDMFLPYCKVLIVSKVCHKSPCRTCYKFYPSSEENDFSFDEWMSIFEDEPIDPSYHFVVYADFKMDINTFFRTNKFCDMFWHHYELKPHDIRLAMWFSIVKNEEQYIYNVESTVQYHFQYVFKINRQKLEKIVIDKIDFKIIEDLQEFFKI